jgi:hypothetical protein
MAERLSEACIKAATKSMHEINEGPFWQLQWQHGELLRMT